jgi:hypothetical protein
MKNLVIFDCDGQNYAEHPAFRKQLDPFHLNLATFMAEAMKIFANRELL